MGKKKRPEAKADETEVKAKSKAKSKAKKDKRKVKKQPAKTPLTEEEQVVVVEQFLADAVRNPELISGMPVVLVCPPEIPEDSPDDNEIEFEGDEEMGMEFLESFMGPQIERSTLLWAQPIESYLSLSGETTMPDILPMIAFVQDLRQHTGRNIVLTIEYAPGESFKSDRPILTTNCIKGKEFLNTLITPFGTFGFIELLTDTNSGKVYGRHYAQISVAALTKIGAKTCSTALSGPLQLTVPWIAESKISYPPQRTNYYTPGTKAMDDALKFWTMFYQGEIMGFDCPEAEMLQSMLLSEERPAVRLYNGSPEPPQILDPDVFASNEVQVLDDIELSDLDLVARVPDKILFDKEAIAWAQERLDIALSNYYDSWHVHEYVIEFSRAFPVVKKQIRDAKVRITKKASLK